MSISQLLNDLRIDLSLGVYEASEINLSHSHLKANGDEHPEFWEWVSRYSQLLLIAKHPRLRVFYWLVAIESQCTFHVSQERPNKPPQENESTNNVK